MKTKVYLVRIVDCDLNHNLKAFLELSSANEYAKYLNDGFDTLYQLKEERMRRVDEVMELVYDSNGYEGTPPFEAVDTWYANERRKLRVPEECTHWDYFATVEEVELVED